MKKSLKFGFFIALLFSVGLVLAAKPDFLAATVENPVTGEPKNTVALPARAVEVAPNIFYLGTAIDDGRVVEGYATITPKKAFGKGSCNYNTKCEPELGEKNSCPDCRNGGGEEPDTSACYGFLSKGANWKTIEPYIVDSSNTEGLTGTFITSNLAADIDKWETAAGVNILGSEISGVVDGADTVSPDDKNEVYFADVDYEGAIAITIVWGVFGGPPPFRELVEWDQVYDQLDFDWSADCLSENCSTRMDFENIATHELGHSVGLDDLYDSKCSEQTMYGYATEGETKKRTLEAGDIAGVTTLYR